MWREAGQRPSSRCSAGRPGPAPSTPGRWTERGAGHTSRCPADRIVRYVCVVCRRIRSYDLIAVEVEGHHPPGVVAGHRHVMPAGLEHERIAQGGHVGGVDRLKYQPVVRVHPWMNQALANDGVRSLSRGRSFTCCVHRPFAAGTTVTLEPRPAGQSPLPRQTNWRHPAGTCPPSQSTSVPTGKRLS